jgi:DNA-binding PadR family transcriptional regulator
MLRDKKITVDITEQGAGPERKLYAITDLGRNDLENWLATPEKLHPNTQTVLFVKVVTSILLDKDPDVYLDTQRSAHIDHMRELTEARRKGDLAQSLQADYTIFHLEADLRWIDVTVARLQNLKQEIRLVWRKTPRYAWRRRADKAKTDCFWLCVSVWAARA